MKTIVIVGGTYEAARRKLEQIVPNDGICDLDFYSEVTLDGHHIVAFGGGEEDVCWLRALGFDVEIVTVKEDGISEVMRKRIRHVRSTARR